MSAERGNIDIQDTLQVGGLDFDIEITDHNDVLVVNVENCETLDQWTGKYDSSYIEELTHKTGNFKQFNIFCSMLESALSKNCQSVSLDLLTYNDLKVLREQKLGGHQRRKQKQNAAEEKLKSKRYLIMTYTVEFDQIHYPLPLMYTGTQDTDTLKQQIKDLRKENVTLKNKRNGSASQSTLDEQEYEKTIQENEELREELDQCQQHLKEIGTGNFGKELKVLKKVVQNLETDLVKERSKHQRLMMKKKKEYDQILQELEDLKASERNYRVRCKNLTEELSILKRHSRLSPAVHTRKESARKITNRSASRDRYQDRGRTQLDRGRTRTNSAQKRISRPPASRRERSLSGSSVGMRTPSPGYRRFDPSAYVKDKEQKRKESEINRSRRKTPSSGNRRIITPVSQSYTRKPPTSGRNTSASKNHFRRRSSSLENYSATNGSDTDNSVNRLRTVKPRSGSSRKVPQRRLRQDAVDSEDEYYNRKKTIPKARATSIKKTKKIECDTDLEGDHSIGIAEIDARLEALKNFMKDNMEP